MGGIDMVFQRKNIKNALQGMNQGLSVARMIQKDEEDKEREEEEKKLPRYAGVRRRGKVPGNIAAFFDPR